MSISAHSFIQDSFLLQSPLAERLYFTYAAQQPIIDFHSHLSPSDIATNKKFENISQVWLAGDHYKWRAMRTYGISEQYITGNASDQEKFMAWAKTVPHTLRNPLFHWTHLELKNSFGIDQLLNPDSGSHVYDHCNQLLEGDAFAPIRLSPFTMQLHFFHTWICFLRYLVYRSRIWTRC